MNNSSENLKYKYNYITSGYRKRLDRPKLKSFREVEFFPKATNRKAWDKFGEHPENQKRRAWIIKKAEAIVGTAWPVLTATMYMEFVRNGNRVRYEDPYFERRRRFSWLVIAECLENRGRFLDEIINGIWAICEESTWCLPAHADRLPKDVLHRFDKQSLDLFACETAMSMALASYLLEDKLNEVSPAVCLRVYEEVDRRIFTPFCNSHVGPAEWDGGDGNWTPWCSSNVLGAALFLEKDVDRISDIAWRTMQIVDVFINHYEMDGGCDEGPAYWNVAGGQMFAFLELLRISTGGYVNIYDEPKIRAMCLFVSRAHISGDKFANFADSTVSVDPSGSKIYRMGEVMGIDELKNFGLQAMRNFKADGEFDPPINVSGTATLLWRGLMDLFWVDVDEKPGQLVKEKCVWLEDVEVLFARESTNPDKGLYLAAKAGHNDERHNHNDVGHFMVYLDGQPGIIDVGRESYCKDTFNENRYKMWCSRGSGHNSPVINGVEQQPGKEHGAGEVVFEQADCGPKLAMNIEKVYSPDAGAEKVHRELELHSIGSENFVRVCDSFVFCGDEKKIAWNFFAKDKVVVSGAGKLLVDCGSRHLVFEFDKRLSVNIEEFPLTDPLMIDSWGKSIYHITFEVDADERTSKYEFKFSPAE